MVKYVYCLRRRDDLTREAFQDYWKTRHADLIRSLADVLGATRYVQSHTYNDPINAGIARSRGLGLEPFDGITELWWPGEAAFMASVSSPEGRAAAKRYIADEANFVDFGRSCAFLSREHVVFER